MLIPNTYCGRNQYLRVPLYKYKLCSTYGYLHTSISSVTPTGELNKYKSAISTNMCPAGDMNKYKSAISTSMCPTEDLNKYKSAISTSMCPTGDLNKYKSAISTSMCISLLYEFMKNYYICYCIYVTVICLL